MKIRYIFVMCMIFAVFATGCSKNSVSVANIEKNVSERINYESVTVCKGNLQPVLTLKIKQEGLKTVNYTVASDNLQINKIYVTAGDKVKAGELLVSFKSDDLETSISEYEKRMEENKLLIDHYNRLMEIDKSLNYKDDIEELNQENYVSGLYVDEYKSKLQNYQIIAKMDGTISKVNDGLLIGTYDAGMTVVKENYGSENYTATTYEDFEFHVGDVYTAYLDVVPYELKIASLNGKMEEDGTIENTIIFEPISDMSSVAENDILIMSIKKPEIKNAVYIESDVIQENEDGYFVYEIGEDGFLKAVKIEIGDTVNDVTIVTSGLQGGEKVAVR